MNIDRLIAAISTLLAAAAIVAAIYTAELNKALGQTYAFAIAGYTIVVWASVLIILQALMFLYFSSLARRDSHKTHVLTLQVDALEKELKRYRDETLLDVVTGIPNQLKLHEDIVEIVNKISEKDQYQVIMLDLDGFGKINTRFGYRKGDLVIKAIAQGIYNSMRRDEEAYKRPFAGSVAPDDLWRRIYRKYSGGDEFIFLIRGTEDEALGFLLRVQRRFDTELGKQVEAILGDPWTLSFHAGLCRLNSRRQIRDHAGTRGGVPSARAPERQRVAGVLALGQNERCLPGWKLRRPDLRRRAKAVCTIADVKEVHARLRVTDYGEEWMASRAA